MLEISHESFERFERPIRSKFIAACSEFLASRPEIAGMAPPVDPARFAAAAYDWAGPAALSASEDIVRLAYISVLITPPQADPVDPLARFGLPPDGEALRALEAHIADTLCGAPS